MKNNPATPHRQSLVHDQWIDTMRVVANTHSDPTAREIATFCGDVLERTDNPRDLTEYLNHRALRAFGDAT